LEQPAGLGCLSLDLKLGVHEIITKRGQPRTEIKENDLMHIVQIVSPAAVSLPGAQDRLKKVERLYINLSTLLNIQVLRQLLYHMKKIQ